jgi:hypothetical protein
MDGLIESPTSEIGEVEMLLVLPMQRNVVNRKNEP